MRRFLLSDTSFTIQKENFYYIFRQACEIDAFDLSETDRAHYADVIHISLRETGFFKNVTQKLYVTVFFVDQEDMKRLNYERRGINKVTDILSFPSYEQSQLTSGDFLKDPEVVLGDLFISPKYCRNDSILMEILFSHHVAHMLTHGTLHLCGYDHEKLDEARIMEDMEKIILENFNIKNPYEETPALPASKDV